MAQAHISISSSDLPFVSGMSLTEASEREQCLEITITDNENTVNAPKFTLPKIIYNLYPSSVIMIGVCLVKTKSAKPSRVSGLLVVVE